MEGGRKLLYSVQLQTILYDTEYAATWNKDAAILNWGSLESLKLQPMQSRRWFFPIINIEWLDAVAATIACILD